MTFIESQIVKIMSETGIYTFEENATGASDIAKIFDEIMSTIDSITLVTFVVTLETELGVEVPDELLLAENLTWNHLCEVIEKLLNTN